MGHALRMRSHGFNAPARGHDEGESGSRLCACRDPPEGPGVRWCRCTPREWPRRRCPRAGGRKKEETDVHARTNAHERTGTHGAATRDRNRPPARVRLAETLSMLEGEGRTTPGASRGGHGRGRRLFRSPARVPGPAVTTTSRARSRRAEMYWTGSRHARPAAGVFAFVDKHARCLETLSSRMQTLSRASHDADAHTVVETCRVYTMRSHISGEVARTRSSRSCGFHA